MAQTNGELKKWPDVSQQGFVFAPFMEDNTFKKLFIRADVFANANTIAGVKYTAVNYSLISNKKGIKYIQASSTDYKAYVKKARTSITKGKLDKVVAARVALKTKPVGFSPVAFFTALCKKYPSAFVSLVYTPQYGLWTGATPEVLLQANATQFKTYSLAGTKANSAANAKSNWGDKEKEEQQLVSDFIIKSFAKVTDGKPVIEGPATASAGNLLHLRSTFCYTGLDLQLWPKVVKHLHPTPAVAGVPRKKAIDLILKNEPSPRGFYSGYLGPVNVNSSVNLFVNLRCMQVLKNKLALHVGCGITRHSKPELEWQESKIKTETLLNVLKG